MHPKIFGGCQNLGASQNLWRMPKPWRTKKNTGAHPCWCSRKSRRTRWRIALLFRLVRICTCWLLSGPTDGLVLLLADVLNRVHVDSKWGMVPQCSAFMGGLSRVLYRLFVLAPYIQNGQSLANAKSLASAWNFIDFSQNIAVSVSAYRRPIKKWWVHKLSPSLSNVSFYTHDH